MSYVDIRQPWLFITNIRPDVASALALCAIFISAPSNVIAENIQKIDNNLINLQPFQGINLGAKDFSSDDINFKEDASFLILQNESSLKLLASIDSADAHQSLDPPANQTQQIESERENNSDSSSFLRKLAGSESIALNISGSVAETQSPIHIDEAVALALSNNYEVQASNEKIQSAHWDKLGAYSEYFPAVTMNAGTGNENSQPASINDAQGNRVLNSTHIRRDQNLTIRQPLIDPSIVSDILSFSVKEDIAGKDRADVREGIAFDTISVYLSLLQACLSVHLAENYKQYLETLASRMSTRVEAGGSANSDLDRIRGRSTMADSAEIEALGDYQTNLTEFKRLTKVTPGELIIPEVLAPSAPESLEIATEHAIKYNPSYLSTLKKADLAESDRKKALSEIKPKVYLQYNYSNSFDAGGAALGNPVDGVWPTQKTQSLMLVAQWSMNGGTAITSGYSGAAKEREMNLHALDIRGHIEQGILAGYTAINAAQKRQDVMQKTVEANERVVTGFEEQFKFGSRSLFDLLDAYEQLYNSRLNLMRVTIAKAKAAYQVRRLMGELIPSIVRAGAK